LVSQNASQQLIDMGRGEGTTRQEVRVTRIEGDVRIKRAGEFHWEAAETNMTLSLGDQVKSSAGGTAQIFYYDCTQTTIKPGSLLEIKGVMRSARAGQRVSEKLNFGEVEGATKRQEGEGSFHEVATDTTTARSSEDAVFSVKSDQTSGEAKVALFSGRLDVEAGGHTLALEEREQVRVESGKPGAVEKLPRRTRLIQPLDEKVFTYPDTSQARTTVVWERVPGAAGYHLRISLQPLFGDPVVDNTAHSTSVEVVGLQSGTYYWRVAVA